METTQVAKILAANLKKTQRFGGKVRVTTNPRRKFIAFTLEVDGETHSFFAIWKSNKWLIDAQKGLGVPAEQTEKTGFRKCRITGTRRQYTERYCTDEAAAEVVTAIFANA